MRRSGVHGAQVNQFQAWQLVVAVSVTPNLISMNDPAAQLGRSLRKAKQRDKECQWF